MEKTQNKSSLFAGIPGIVLLLVLAVTAVYFHVQTVAAFFFLLLFLCGASFFWSRSVLKKASLSIRAENESAGAGEKISLKISLKNNSFFPLTWLDVILPTGKEPLLRLEDQDEDLFYTVPGQYEKEAGIRLRFAWLLWQQEITWDEELVTRRRGVVRLRGAVLEAGDGLGFSASERFVSFPAPVRLVIYPKILPVNTQPFLKASQEAVSRNQGTTEDITILKSSRPYSPNDPAKRINWRLLAESGEMTVNVYETVTPGCMTFVLDLESFRLEEINKTNHSTPIPEYFLLKRDMERMISLAASCMCAVFRRQIPVAVVIPGYGETDPFISVPLEGDPSLYPALEALSEVGYSGETTRFPLEEFRQSSHRLGDVFVCTRSEESCTLGYILTELGRSRARYIVLSKKSGEAGEFETLQEENLCLERADFSEYEQRVSVNSFIANGGSYETTQ